MCIRAARVRFAVALATLLLMELPAGAAQLRYHFVPVDAYGNTCLQPAAASVAPGESLTWLGTMARPYPAQPRPTHLVTFRHPCTGLSITVPVRFPEGRPRLEHRPCRIIYNYGSYTVEAHFLSDGSVDVIYNSGLLRAP